MKTFTIVIPTTKDLVGITDITVENPTVSCVICVNNNLESLPISSQYDNFVKSPTGIIEKITGNSSYRIDLSNKIDQGDSWQLALAIAHILHHNNKLTLSKDKDLINNETESIIWATGLIDSNLSINPITFLEQKFLLSLDFFKLCIKKNIKISIILSSDNKNEFTDIFNKINFLNEAVSDKKIEIIFIDNLKTFLLKFNLKHLIKTNNIQSFLYSKIKNKLKWTCVIILLITIFFSFSSMWKVINPLYKLKNNNDFRGLLTSLSSYRQGDFPQRVGAYVFDYFQGIEVNNLNNQIVINFLPYSKIDNINLKNRMLQYNCLKNDNIYNHNCKLNVELTNIGEDKLFLWMISIKKSNNLKIKTNKSKFKSQIINGLIPSKETISIDIKENDNSLVLFFVYGKKFDNNISKWLLNLSSGSALLKSTANRIKSLGFGYSIKKIQNVKFISDVIKF